MYLINRAIAVIKPKQPFLEWLNRMPNPPVELTLDELQTDCTTILIPEFDYRDDSQSFIEGISAQVFEMELDSWYHDPNLWPASFVCHTFDTYCLVWSLPASAATSP